MFKKIKLVFLWLAQSFGLFALCRFMFRRHLRVLCYHGFAYLDEHLYRPKLFMTPETFKQRFAYLARGNYQIVSLAEGLANPQRPYQLALTMDDGWSGTIELVGDTLKQHQFPLMLYVTSYYADKQIAVLNVAVSYLLWKTTAYSIDFQLSQYQTDAEGSVSAKLPVNRPDLLVKELCLLLDRLPDARLRQQALDDLARQLGVPLEHNKKQLFRLLNIAELAELQNYNVDLQLHTHRHQSPLDPVAFAREVEQNRNWLAQLKPEAQLVHFCYPSGEYSVDHLSLLFANAIQTATTTHIGLHKQGSDVLQINRILDGEDVTVLELEAELCGFMSLFRRTFFMR